MKRTLKLPKNKDIVFHSCKTDMELVRSEPSKFLGTKLSEKAKGCYGI